MTGGERSVASRDAVRSPLVRALVAVDHPLPVDMIGGLEVAVGADLATDLARLELAGLIDWADDGTVAATAEAVATIRLSGGERSELRGVVGRAAIGSAMPAGLVATWLLDGCRILPDRSVVPQLLAEADRALRTGDLADSAAVLEAVARAVERGHPCDALDRVRVYVRLGYVLRWLDRVDDAERVVERAVTHARATGDPIALAVAALAWHPNSIAVSDDPSAVTVVDDALVTLGDADDETRVALRSRLLSHRADAVLFSDLDAARSAATAALLLARATDDAETFLQAAYSYRLAHWHPAGQDEVLALAAEMLTASPRAVDFAEYGALVRLQIHLERGDWPHLDNELAAMGRRLRAAPRPFELLWWQVVTAARAQTRGAWGDADELVDASLQIASGPVYGPAFQLLLTQKVLAAWQRGDDLVPLVDAELLPAGPMRAGWEAALLGWTAERRGAAEVTAELDHLLPRGTASIRPDLTFGPVSASLAIAAAEAGSRRHAGMLLSVLEPYADQWAATSGAVVMGPFALHLGRLASVIGRTDRAVAFLEHAERRARGGACTPWLARIHLARSQVESEPEARRHYARQAESAADAVGMVGVSAAARALLGLVGLPAGLTEREAEVLRLLVDGATNVQIAERLYLSVKTVERHLLNAYRKAGVRNRAEAAVFALRELT